MGACAALRPAARPLPRPTDPRIQRDGARLRAYGASLQSAALAEASARRLIGAYAASLDVPGEPGERRTRVNAVVQAARVQALPETKNGFTCLAELDLTQLQQTLGTNYDLSP